MIKVLLFEDNSALRNSLSALIGGTDGFELAGVYPDCNGVDSSVAVHKPDVVLMDIDMPGMSGLEGLQHIKQNYPGINVLMLTVYDDDENVFQAVRLGATGYLLKKTSPAKILEAIIEAKEGGAPMTPSVARRVLEYFPKTTAAKPEEFQLTVREREVLALFVDGYSYKMAAAELDISVYTIQDYVKSIYRKLRVHSLPAAVAKAIRNNVV
ncbi:MAG TPA: response regulator transcription factor [Bacteroidia bacterium]|nr:response regulator transcription factor [Bacteroidia bacterium]